MTFKYIQRQRLPLLTRTGNLCCTLLETRCMGSWNTRPRGVCVSSLLLCSGILLLISIFQLQGIGQNRLLPFAEPVCRRKWTGLCGLPIKGQKVVHCLDIVQQTIRNSLILVPAGSGRKQTLSHINNSKSLHLKEARNLIFCPTLFLADIQAKYSSLYADRREQRIKHFWAFPTKLPKMAGWATRCLC